MAAPRASFVKRAWMSAGAGPYLFGAAVVLGAVGLFLGPLYVPICVVMALAAPVLQMPRQKAWLTQNDMLEFASLGAMPVLLAVLAFVWLAPAGVLSLSNIQFDDWMWKLSDTRVLNRAYMKKYGVDIGEVIITFERQP